jgi:hypothetical protein
MMLSIESLKELITDSPGIDNPRLAEILEISCARVQRWVDKLVEVREDNGSGAWLFKQKKHGRNAYFTSVYAKSNNTPEIILKPRDRSKEYIKAKASRKNMTNNILESSGASWPAPKRLLG